MIQVTLNFPDQAALLAFFAKPTMEVEAPKAEAPKTVSKVPKITVPAPSAVETPSPSSSSTVAAADTTSSEKPSASVDYPTLQKAVFALAGKSRESAGAVAASFGVKTFKELPEAKWGEALAAVNAALAA